jgi:hypothetical protein
MGDQFIKKGNVMSYYHGTNYAKIEDMIGKVFTSVKNVDDESLVFENDTERYVFYHSQDCCESVQIEDVTGDLSDLEGVPLLRAEESTNLFDIIKNIEKEFEESGTWTFYKFATRKGYVDVRWLGESNGYYSESVDLRYETI